MFNKKTILKKTILIGGCAQISRLLGIVREILTSRYLGITGLSDAFFTAYKIPNSLRRAFAEGALSAAFIPATVEQLHNKDKQSIAGLMSISFIVFEGLCLAIVLLSIYNAPWIITSIAPGFAPYQVTIAVQSLKILMPFIFFISSSALLAGPLQAIGHFLIPAISPILLNVFFITALILCNIYSLSLDFLCWFIICGGCAQFIVHLITFFHYNFSFGYIQKKDIRHFSSIFFNFALCLPSVGIEELNLFIDTRFASCLKPGSVSLIYLANRFMAIPLGVFAVSLSTVLLPHFSKIRLRAPNRLSFYLLESFKFVLWVTLPVALIMAFFSQKIFYTLFLSDTFTVERTYQAGDILIAFLSGLFFFSINKILVNIYYALHVTWIPGVISLITVTINWILNSLLIDRWQTAGLAFASSLSEIIRTCIFMCILAYFYNFKMYFFKIFIFLVHYAIQIISVAIACLLLYYTIEYCIDHYCIGYARQFLLHMIGYWLWVGPLCGIYFFLLWRLRTLFKVHIFFLD